MRMTLAAAVGGGQCANKDILPLTPSAEVGFTDRYATAFRERGQFGGS